MELPTASMPVSSLVSRNLVTASARVRIETSPDSGGVAPKPGRSSAITSRSAARLSRIGVHERQLPPRPWRRSSGLPLPLRT
jgi:hypothetical protein